MLQCTFVILGATGDLTRRKLIPAIYHLVKDKKITSFALVGVALPRTSEKRILAQAKKFIKDVQEPVWKRIEDAFSYLPFDFYQSEDYTRLREHLSDVECLHKLSGNRIFYLATMPEHFGSITENLAISKIVQTHNGVHTSSARPGCWARIVYEKPFGHDVRSARSINKSISSLFSEQQIYRIDHYLGKDLVGNIALARFTNRIFEPLWNNKHIDSVEIVLSEQIGLEGRGEFYDATGAINDMVQSHMLQIMALIAMESPRALSGKYIRDAKARLLSRVQVHNVTVGQYAGYTSEPGVARGSKTETFAALDLRVSNRRWNGVPFYLTTGKFLSKKEAVVRIKFKMIKCLLGSCPSEPNYLTIRIQPDEGLYLNLNSKVPGAFEVTPVRMHFSHTSLFGPNTPEAYENLLSDVMRGDQSVFLRSDEIEYSWRIVERIKHRQGVLHRYRRGSTGPAALRRVSKH